jgi:hypothetical protein
MLKRRWMGTGLFVLLVVLFLIANRGAYKGYFSDDELDNLSWAPGVHISEYARTLVTPQFIPGNFRPVGHFFFYLAGKSFGLDFPKYVFPIHALHLLNVWLLWFLIRRMGGSAFAAGAGALLFAFHMAVFDLYWKPMYVFDLLCATFCLLALLAWVHQRWVLAFVAFWLAYKSKELAVMLPLVLACYEYWVGKRNWKPLAPFFAVSLSFGLQGVLLNPHQRGDYAFSYKPEDLWQTVNFYSDRVLLLPKAGFAMLFVPAIVRDRRVWFGIATLLLFFFPLAFLPGRHFGAYCYVPLIGAGIALSGIADRGHRLFVTIVLLCWVPFNYIHLRLNRRQELAVAANNRRYVTAVQKFAALNPGIDSFIYDGRPFALRPWGIKGAVAYAYGTTAVDVYGLEERGAQRMLRGNGPLALMSWDSSVNDLAIVARRKGVDDAAFIRMDRFTPLWQLDDGWFGLESGFRWMKPVATAHLERPAGARRFALKVNIGPDMIRDMGGTEVRLFLDRVALGSRRFAANGWQQAAWDLPPGTAGRVNVRLEATPYHPSNKDPRALGVAVGEFGFVE